MLPIRNTQWRLKMQFDSEQRVLDRPTSIKLGDPGGPANPLAICPSPPLDLGDVEFASARIELLLTTAR